MSGVPYTFGTATTSIPLSNLDSNFVTPVTIGNASVALGNTISTIGNLTLNNVTINGGTINASVTESYTLANAVVYSNSSNVGVTSAGLTFNGTNLTLGTSNGGIIFNNSSELTNSTLNDYEVGSWTPNQGSGLVVVGTFSSTGSYTKVGRMVTVNIAYYGSTSVATTGTGVGSNNFPFTTYAGKLYTAVVCNNAGNFGGVEITGTASYFQTAIPAQPQMFMSFTYECNF